MRKTIPLKDGWEFCTTKAAAGPQLPEVIGEACEVSVPHVWNKDDPGKAGCRMYRRVLTIAETAGERVFVEFEAVAGVCRVWLQPLSL